MSNRQRSRSRLGNVDMALNFSKRARILVADRTSPRPRSMRSPAPVLSLLAAVASALVLLATPSSTPAMHLKNAGEERLERVHRNRLDRLPARFPQIGIAPGGKPRALARDVEELPSGFRQRLEGSSALSLLYYDGATIKFDWKRHDIRDDLPLFGASMSKGITSYLLGRAHCDGLVASLEDRIAKYVPTLADTFYGNARIGDALDMASGDRFLYANSARRGGRAQNREYVAPVMRRQMTVAETLRAFGKRDRDERAFAYRNANTDAIAMVVGAAAPGGLGAFAQRTLAADAGLEHRSFFLADRDGAALAFGFFYATRLDWLRAAIRIGEDARSEGCIGDYLRSAAADSVSVDVDNLPYRRYGKFFWSDRKRMSRRHIAMMGHGGQQALIELDGGRVLVVFAIRGDYAPSWTVKKLFD